MNKYAHESFHQQIARSYAYDRNVYIGNPEWELVETLYNQNYLQTDSKAQKIPKIIHQVWLGSSFPKELEMFANTWKHFHKDWEYKLWTDENIHEFPIAKEEIYLRSKSFGMRSDLIRYEALKKYGGLYVDTDFEALKSFEDFLYLDFVIGASYDTKLQLYNGLIASVPNHPIIKKCLSSLSGIYEGLRGSRILDITGANHLTRTFLSVVTKNTEGVVAFPTGFFYPYPNNVRGSLTPYKYLQTHSYAIHHWNVSWKNKSV